MSNILVEQMSQLIALSPAEALVIEQAFPIKNFPKGAYLLKEGQVAQDAFIVIEGCVRRYSLTDGEEATHDFYTEGDSFADFSSMHNKKPSRFFFVCVEPSVLAVLNSEKEAQLYRQFPRFEAVCRVEFEKMMGEKADKTEAFLNSSPEDRYLQLLQERPDLFNRVPQYQIASYLGIQPESLSRIRKRITVK